MTDDLAEQEEEDDWMEEQIDDYMQMVTLLMERGVAGPDARLIAPQLLIRMKLDDIETAVMSFNDNIMHHLETADSTKGPAMIKWTTEELLKHYNPEVLECIKDGDAELEVYDDRIVITKPIKPDA